MTASTPPFRRTDNASLGILMMLVSVFLFSILNVLVKTLSDTYPVTEISFFRNAFALVPVVVAVAVQGGAATLRTARPLGHVWRSAIGLCAMMLMFWSFALLPLADAIALNFTTPLILTALSVPLLGEKVGVHRWSAVAVGFVGVLVIVRPTGAVLELGAAVAIAAAFCQSLAMVAIRQLSRSEPPNTIVFYFTVLTTLMSACTLPFAWVTPTPGDFMLLALTGLVGGMAQLFLTRAYSLAQAATVAPFNYTSLLWAVLFGWLLWGELPEVSAVIGAGIVALSGLYILQRETRRRSDVVTGGRSTMTGND
ncbi:DMT family transporter [Azospirillum halopraeferens]|uniref:DMT family transporter n=1 Tax=Azospirillum halopraeferens TaxID=34010 RepID=UPI0005577CE8|nr:DMT family transporter [Azospirillum halopraeferens]